MTRWRKLRDVALLEVFSGNRGIEVDCGDQAHEAVAPLRSSLDGDVGNCDVIGVKRDSGRECNFLGKVLTT